MGGRQLLSKAYIAEMLAPSATNPTKTGLPVVAETGKARYPAATERSVFALGAGSNIIWVEPENDPRVVGRWADQTNSTPSSVMSWGARLTAASAAFPRPLAAA